MKTKLYAMFVLVLTLSLLVVGCAPKEKTLKIGVVGPYTGASARIGEEMKDAVTMAFENVNNQICDYKVQLIWVDEEADPEKATRAYEEAIVRDEIDAGLMNWHSSVAVALMEVAARYKVPHFFAQGATKVVVDKYQSDPEKYSYWVGKVWPITEKLTVVYVLALEEAIEKGLWTPKQRVAALIAEDTDWGRSWARGIRPQLEEKGWTIATEDYVGSEETEFYPLLNKLNDLGASLVLVSDSFPPSISAFIKQAREVELKALIVGDGIGWIGEWYDLTGDASNYVLDSIPQWGTEEQKTFAQSFHDKYGIDLSPSSGGLAYDLTNFTIKLMQEACEKNGKLDRESLHQFAMDKLEAGEMVYTDGLVMDRYEYTTETFPDPVVGAGYFMFPVIQYFDGEGKIIWPEAMRSQELQLPPWLTE